MIRYSDFCRLVRQARPRPHASVRVDLENRVVRVSFLGPLTISEIAWIYDALRGHMPGELGLDVVAVEPPAHDLDELASAALEDDGAASMLAEALLEAGILLDRYVTPEVSAVKLALAWARDAIPERTRRAMIEDETREEAKLGFRLTENPNGAKARP